MKPGFGEVLLAEGDPRVRDEEQRLIAEFRRQLDQGMWAAVPTSDPATGRREALMVQDYAEVPREADRVIGRRATRPIQADETIREDMLE